VAGEGFLDGAESPSCIEEIAYPFAEVLGLEIVQVDGFTFGEVLSTSRFSHGFILRHMFRTDKTEQKEKF
jgi:hypothetical protein